MRILVFGARGMLGHKLIQVLSEDAEVTGTVRGTSSDLAHFGLLPEERVLTGVGADDVPSIRRALETSRPDVVINAIGVVNQVPMAKDVIATLSVNSIFPHR